MTGNSPYPGLRPFKEEEQDKFFGRLPEIHILTDKILADRVTLLVAASGVGKSSLLQVGVMPALRATGLADLVYHNDWAFNPAEALKKAIVAHFIAQQRVNADYQADFSLPLPAFLQIHALLATGTLVIFLDQFEEFFYYQRFSQQRDEFIRQLAGAIQDTVTPTTFVFSMREDFAMELEAFKPWFAGIFSNIYRIEKLGLEAARRAIEGPVQAAGFTYQPDLLDKLLADLGQRERNQPLDLQPFEGQELTQPLVEPPLLQIVCQQVWLAASASTGCEITIQHYQNLGATNGILTRYFDDKMAKLNASQRRLASNTFEILVDQPKAKLSYLLDELASLLNQNTPALEKTLDELQKSAILRRVLRQGHPWYEFCHDVFAKHTVAWNQAFKRKQRQRQLILRAGALVLAGMAAGLAYDGWMNGHTQNFLSGRWTVSSKRVEPYHWLWGSRDIFHQKKFVYESDYERRNIEVDKRPESDVIADPKQTVLMQIGQLAYIEQYAAYVESGLLANASDLFEVFHKISGLLINANELFDVFEKIRYKQLSFRIFDLLTIARVQQTIDHFLTFRDIDEADVRSEMVRRLRNLRSQAAIKSLLALLNDDRLDMRMAAIKALSDLQVQEAIQPLLAFLKEDKADVRQAVIDALTGLHAQEAIKPLLVLLKDDKADVRRMAINALSDLQAQEAIHPLLALLKDHDADVRSTAINALGNLNAQAATQPLLILLKDPDNYVRLEAIKALAVLKDQTAIPALLALLKEDNSDLRKAAIEVLSDLNAQAAVQPLLALLKDPDNNVRLEAIEALAVLKDQTAIPALLALLKDDKPDVRQATVKALINLNAQAAIPALLALLENSNADVRNSAMEVLGSLKSHATIQPLLALLKDSNADVRLAAIQVLGGLNTQVAIQPLLALLKDSDADVCRAAIGVLGNLKVQAVVKPLLALLKDADVYERLYAIRALSDLSVQAAIPHLLALLKDNEADVRVVAISTLGNLRAQAAIQPLLVLMKDNTREVRQAAIHALTDLRAEAVIQPLLDLQEEYGIGVYAALKRLKVLMMGVDDQSLTPTEYSIEDITKYSIKDITEFSIREQFKEFINKDIIFYDLSREQTLILALSRLAQPPAKLTEWQAEQVIGLEAALKNGTDLKRNIAYQLGFVPVAKAVELLTLLLKENDVDTVTNAVWALGNIAEIQNAWIQPYTQQFIAFSQNQDIGLQQAAIKALGQVSGGQPNQAAQQQLLKIANDTIHPDYLRLAAVDALGSTGQSEITTLLINLLQDKNQATLHFAIVYWLAKMPVLADKKEALLSLLQQRLAGLEQDKANWRKLRDAYKTGQSENEKPIVCYDSVQGSSGQTRWCDDYKIYQYAYAIAMQDPENAGLILLSHPLYQARAAAIRVLEEKASGELLKKLLAYYQDFHWQDLPSPRPYTTYRAIDKVLAQLENGSEHDLKILQGLKIQLAIPSNSKNPTNQEQQQAALIQRFDWTIAELAYRLKWGSNMPSLDALNEKDPFKLQ